MNFKLTKHIIYLLILLAFWGCKQTPPINVDFNNIITTNTEWSESDF